MLGQINRITGHDSEFMKHNTIDALQDVAISDDAEYGTGCTISDLWTIEDALNVRLPSEYKTFLLNMGWYEGQHISLFGIAPYPFRHLNVLNVIISERTARPALPTTLIPVMNVGNGDLYCLNISKANTSPVVLWSHESASDQEYSLISQSFDAFIRELILTHYPTLAPSDDDENELRRGGS